MTRGQRIRMRRGEIPRFRNAQQGLADCIGVSRTTVSDWENGKAAPRGENLVRLAKCLEVSVEWIEAGPVHPVSNRVMQLRGRDPAGVRRFDAHVGLGSWISMAIDDAETSHFTREELLELLREIQGRAEEAERTIGQLYQELRRLGGNGDVGGGRS